MAYTAEQKSQAKALVASYGNAAQAIPVLEEIWPEVPDPVTLWRWATNPAIQPDTRWVQDFATQINARVIGMVDSMLGPLKERIEGQIANGKSLDLHNDVRSFTFLTNLVRPANATGYGSGDTYIDARDQRTVEVVMPYGPKDPDEVDEAKGA